MGDGDDLIGSAGGGSSPAVRCVVDPSVVLQLEVALVLARVPVVSTRPEAVLATVDPPHHPPVASDHLQLCDRLHGVCLPRQAGAVLRQVRQAAVLGHALKQVDEGSVAVADGHLALELALGLVRLA